MNTLLGLIVGISFGLLCVTPVLACVLFCLSSYLLVKRSK